MTATPESVSSSRPKALQVILLGGLIAGTLDITGACVVSYFRSAVMPIRVFQSVASGLLGAASYSGGAKTAALGIALHYLIATVWTAVFYFASLKLRFLVKQAVVSGLLYGVVVYVFMNFVVLPLSAFPQPSVVSLTGRIIGLLIIIFCIGLPIALIVRKKTA